MNLTTLEKNFESIIRRFGHNVYLQRVLNSEQANEVPQYTQKLERWTVYSQFPGGSVRADSVMEESDEGLTSDVDIIFYFQAEVNPTMGDLIYEEMDRYPNREAVYEIEYAIPMKGYGGRLVFWEVAAMRLLPV